MQIWVKIEIGFHSRRFFLRQNPLASTAENILLATIRGFGSNTPETGYFPLFRLSKALITNNPQASLYGGIPQWLYFHYEANKSAILLAIPPHHLTLTTELIFKTFYAFGRYFLSKTTLNNASYKFSSAHAFPDNQTCDLGKSLPA